jgi:site-specific DNA recombinase
MKNQSNDAFQRYAKFSDTPIVRDINECVAYTRVSSKEQQDNTLSLSFQRKHIDEYANRHSLNIQEYFGGRFESAKTDGRKEFQRMLTYIRQKRGKIRNILVYTTSRFSRTGGDAIKLAKDLREKYGVHILAVTQPTDTSNVSGVFQQNIQLLFSEYDNQLRKQGAVDGSTEKLEKGIWCLKPPMGYDAVKINNERKIVINKTGEKLRKAFEWKIQGMTNEEILTRLHSLGVSIYKQKLSMIFSNPFYAGIIVNKMLNGRVIKGKHPSLITEEQFLTVNNIRAAAKGKYGILHDPEKDMLPLKVFTKCKKCGSGYTGYLVKSKNIYYYKCRQKGCKCNQNAAKMNEQFLQFLSNYCIRPELIAPLCEIISRLYNKFYESTIQEQKELEGSLKEVQKHLDTIEEKYYVLETMDSETYRKLKPKYQDRKSEILNSLEKYKYTSSNLTTLHEDAILISANIATAWSSSGYKQRDEIQKIVFPEGVYYDREKEAFRTNLVNPAFEPIPHLNCISGGGEKEQETFYGLLSSRVGWTKRSQSF